MDLSADQVKIDEDSLHPSEDKEVYLLVDQEEEEGEDSFQEKESILGDEEVEDDEETIEAEEAMEPDLDPSQELQFLAQDAGMSLEELHAITETKRTRRQKPVELQGPSTSQDSPYTSFVKACAKKYDELEIECESKLRQFYLSSHNRGESDASDEEYTPLKTLNKEIRVGEKYQALIKTFEDMTEDDIAKLEEPLWVPPTDNDMSDKMLKDYIEAANRLVHDVDKMENPSKFGSDNPLALNCLMTSNYNPKAALDLLHTKLLAEKYSPDDIALEVNALCSFDVKKYWT